MSCTVFPLAAYRPAKMANHLVDSSADSVVVSTNSLLSSPSSSSYGIVASSPINAFPVTRSVDSVRRALFGPTDSQANRRFALDELNKIATNDERRWNFDFTNDLPLSGRFKWTEASSSGRKVPACYKSISTKETFKARPDISKRIPMFKTTTTKRALKICEGVNAARRSLSFEDPKDSPATSPKFSPSSTDNKQEICPITKSTEVKDSINIQDNSSTKSEESLNTTHSEETLKSQDSAEDWSDAEDETETISVSEANTSIDRGYIRSSKKRVLDCEEKLESRKKAKRQEEPLQQQQSA